jgi:hypothetical protein
MLIQLRLDLKGLGYTDEQLQPGIADADRLSGSGANAAIRIGTARKTEGRSAADPVWSDPICIRSASLPASDAFAFDAANKVLGQSGHFMNRLSRLENF